MYINMLFPDEEEHWCIEQDTSDEIEDTDWLTEPIVENNDLFTQDLEEDNDEY